jgi:hypothetical protein
LESPRFDGLTARYLLAVLWKRLLAALDQSGGTPLKPFNHMSLTCLGHDVPSPTFSLDSLLRHLVA